ncbi:unnamed protein product [Peniophora sp. CBMAI 1063]|nr:unnamed protein product [Peniophora sp. CBMAI 1063]
MFLPMHIPMSTSSSYSEAVSPSTTTPPVLRLPTELINRIFLFIAAHYRVTDEYLHAPPCLFLTHICRRWRTVALDCQELWSTRLPRSSPRWTDLCLSRAPTIPLDAAIEYEFMDTDAAYHQNAWTVLSQWSRIRSLRVHALYQATFFGVEASAVTMLNSLLEALSGRNTELEQLELSYQTQSTPPSWFGFELPQVCAGEQPPKLRDLQLTNLALPSATPSLLFTASLCSLKLYETKAWTDVNAMIQCLQATPMLQTLEYIFSEYYNDRRWAFDFQPSRQYHERCVHLPHLEHLKLGCFWIHTITIFKYIAAPSRCNVDIFQAQNWASVKGQLNDDTVTTHAHAAREAFTQHFAAAIAQEETFDFVRPSRCAISAKSISGHSNSETRLLPSTFDLRLSDAGAWETGLSVVTAMLAQLPVFAGTQHITFSRRLYTSNLRAFDVFTNVRKMTFYDRNELWEVASILRSKGDTFLPVLEDVVLAEGHFVESDANRMYDFAKALRDAYVKSACKPRLCVPGKHISREILDELRSLVGPQRLVN